MTLPLALAAVAAWAAVVRGLLARSHPETVSVLCERCYRPYERSALGEPVCRCDR